MHEGSSRETHGPSVFRALPLPLLAVVVAGLTAACKIGATPTPRAEPVNLVIVSIDTLRPDHLGCYGYHRDTSPTLDRLAASSIVFDQAVTTHVTTAPAHASILTGRSPSRHGLIRNGMRLDPGVPTLAELLTGEGLAAGAFVSGWTLQRHTGLDRGFEVYDDDLGPPRAGARRDGRDTTDAALDWLVEQIEADRRFFLFLHLFEPHWPYDPPAGLALQFLPGRYELKTLTKPVHIDRRLSVNRLTPPERDEYAARYDGEIVVADRLLGRLLDALDDLEVAGSTVVVVLSDHGETLFEREWAMDHGARPYDEQARVPLILHVPNDPDAGRRIADQVSLLDVVPTVAQVLGFAPLEDIEGRSLLPLPDEADDPWPVRPAFITARSEPQRVAHIRAPLRSRGVVCAVRLPNIKLIEYPRSRDRWYPELFDLEADPGEQANLAGERTDAVLALHRQLEAWRTATATGRDVPSAELDPEVEEALRELGYLGD